MLNYIYKLSPLVVKQIWVLVFKTFRKTLFVCFGLAKTKHCVNDNLNLKDFADFQMKRRYGPLKHFCYAPHASMFFSLHGKMSPCYATYNEKSDIVSKISIKESWVNGSFERIRKEHLDCNFEENCKFCFNLYKNKAYGSMLQQKYEHYAFTNMKYPAIMEFELSNRCNLECIMCDAHLSSSISMKNQNDPSGNDIYDERFLEKLKEFIPHLQKAEFTGGDPFLIEIYYKIWDMIITINPKCDILITTNANTMNERIERLMAKTKKLHFNISVDALNKETYESIRINGNFEKVLKNIDIFNNYYKKNKTSMNLLVCPMTVNRYELPGLVKFGNSKNIGVFFHTVVKPQHLSLKYQSPEMLNELIDYLQKFSFGSNTYNEKTNAENYLNLIRLLESWKCENVTAKPEQIKKSTSDLVYERITKSDNPEIISKAQEASNFFEAQNQTVQMLEVLNKLEADILYQMVLNKSAEDLIKFVKQEIEKNN